ncbi:hypothetical protein AU05_17240 [Ectopseudomonas composti]|uniref:Winged helix-turn-helix domain-containing protein n=1 Tax=Ectopseudomonas composti TaxID=658457 RepID=A0ABN0SAQ0_9GAMM|nr:helix-turn-helix domain-containing protein [Pseudomonas composti]EZH79563.1 hypothetical protein AU05_17240 [Pseudomonas composti]
MADKKKADQQACPEKTPINDTSTSAQRARLLARLQQEAVDTFTAIRELNIVRPGARIAELRAAGHPIKTQRITMADDQGREHRGIARYYLGTAPTRTEGAPA